MTKVEGQQENFTSMPYSIEEGYTLLSEEGFTFFWTLGAHSHNHTLFAVVTLRVEFSSTFERPPKTHRMVVNR